MKEGREGSKEGNQNPLSTFLVSDHLTLPGVLLRLGSLPVRRQAISLSSRCHLLTPPMAFLEHSNPCTTHMICDLVLPMSLASSLPTPAAT
jgi:hypothetical protein